MTQAVSVCRVLLIYILYFYGTASISIFAFNDIKLKKVKFRIIIDACTEAHCLSSRYSRQGFQF